jgi:serine/threonine protein kinase
MEGRAVADLGGRYRLVRRLGAGGMGEVWLAADEALDDRPVAIKLMRSEMLADAVDVARFQREMRLASRMNHPNIMTVFTTGTDNGVPFMVMEYLEGSDLSRTPSSWRPDDVARIGRETCAALVYAHSLSPGVVHRDIKPANLFICTGGQVKVTDFGIAKAVSGTRLSATGSWIGTLPYMAPEQWLGEPAAFSNDIWAVGCVLYELLSGGLPRSYTTPPEYLAAAMRGEPVPPLPAAADVPGWLSDTVMAMLQPAPGDRPAAAQCVQMLSSPPVYTDPDPVIPARPGADLGPQRVSRSAAPSARWSPRRRLLLSGALAVVTAAALVIGYVATHGGGGRNTLAGGAPDVSASALTAAHHMASGHPVSGHSVSDPAPDPSASGPSGSVHPTASRTSSRSSSPAQQAPPKAAAETWSQIGVRQGADLTSVSCAGQGLCAATASGGGIYVYQGSSWSSEASTANVFGTVTCPSTSFCAAAGYASGGNIFTFDGSSWSAPDLIDPGYKLHSVACASASFCVAGASVNMFVDSGGSWSGPDAVDPNDANGNGVEAVSCASSSFCVAVDAIGNALTYANGSWSSPLDIDNGGQLKSVSCTSSSFCVAVGAAGNALVYSGGSWSSSREIDGVSLDSVSCTSSSFCMAVDAQGDALTYTNGSWSSPRAVSGAGVLDSVSCTSASYCVAVDDLGNSFTRR